MVYIFLINLILCCGSRGCDYFYAGPVELALNNLIGNVVVNEILSISFELQLHETCSSGSCHLLRIFNDGFTRLPMITIPASSGAIRSLFSDSNGLQTKIDYSDSYLLSSYADGNYHKFYFKWSEQERIFSFDDIVYGNITNGAYDSSQYTNQEYGLWVVDTTR